MECVAALPAGGSQVCGALLHAVHTRQADQPAAGGDTLGLLLKLGWCMLPGCNRCVGPAVRLSAVLTKCSQIPALRLMTGWRIEQPCRSAAAACCCWWLVLPHSIPPQTRQLVCLPPPCRRLLNTTPCPARRAAACSTRMQRWTSTPKSGPAPSATRATTSRRTTRVRATG